MRAQNSDRLTLEETLRVMRDFNGERGDEMCCGYADGFLNLPPSYEERTEVYWRSHRHGSEARSRGAHAEAREKESA